MGAIRQRKQSPLRTYHSEFRSVSTQVSARLEGQPGGRLFARPPWGGQRVGRGFEEVQVRVSKKCPAQSPINGRKDTKGHYAGKSHRSNFRHSCTSVAPKIEIRFRNLLRQLGYDIPLTEDGFGLKTEQAVFAFRIHYAGQEILASREQTEAWHGIAQNKDVDNNQRLISRLDENDALFLEDLVKQLNDAS